MSLLIPDVSEGRERWPIPLYTSEEKDVQSIVNLPPVLLLSCSVSI